VSTAPAVTRDPVKERLAAVLDALSYGLNPPDWQDCPACRAAFASRCEPCGQALADITLIDRVAAQIGRPGMTEAEALALYAKTFIMLTGLKPGEFSGALSGGGR
jgi:hypothetical protein